MVENDDRKVEERRKRNTVIEWVMVVGKPAKYLSGVPGLVALGSQQQMTSWPCESVALRKPVRGCVIAAFVACGM